MKNYKHMSMDTSNYWMVKLPDKNYSQMLRFGVPVMESEARAAVRQALGLPKVPVGTHFWK